MINILKTLKYSFKFSRNVTEMCFSLLRCMCELVMPYVPVMSGLNCNEYAKDILYHEITPHKGAQKIRDGELIKDGRD